MTYTYDAMGNMLQRSISRSVADENGGPPSMFVAASRSFTYLKNASGNNLSKLQTVTENGLDHSVAYDNAGNETAYIMFRTYSARNLLSSVQDAWETTATHRIAYAYDGRGIRVQKSESPTGYTQNTAIRDYIYSPDLQLLSVSRPNNPTIYGKRAVVNDVLNAQYDIVWFGGTPVAHIDYDSGTTRSTFTDHLGTPIIQLNTADGSTFWQPEYEPFGNIWQMRVGNPADQPLRFPGQERAMDWEGTEENYNIFRWYRSGWGRYTQSDPIASSYPVSLLGSTFSRAISNRDLVGLAADIDQNPFGYTRGNPIEFADPLGLQYQTPGCDRVPPCWSMAFATDVAFAMMPATRHLLTARLSRGGTPLRLRF
jgi:RHS repeat-associated protein